MSLLAHAAFGYKMSQVERRNIDKDIQSEIRAAKIIQRETGCAWTEALLLAKSTINFAVKPL